MVGGTGVEVGPIPGIILYCQAINPTKPAQTIIIIIAIGKDIFLFIIFELTTNLLLFYPYKQKPSTTHISRRQLG